MQNRSVIGKAWHRCMLALGAGATALVLSSGAFAQHAGGGGGGAHGGGAVGGFHGGAPGGFRGGVPGGWRGGGYYGWRGGYPGWRGGWGWGCCGWGWWGPGLALGLYFSTLPLYYTTYWWNGVPYYFADNTYYVWNPDVSQYETVAPPPGVAAQVPGQGQGGQPGAGASGSELMVYPKNGQNADQTAHDKFECHQWAVSQSGFDPTQAGQGQAANPGRRNDYLRAQAACLEGRGYSVM